MLQFHRILINISAEFQENAVYIFIEFCISAEIFPYFCRIVHFCRIQSIIMAEFCKNFLKDFLLHFQGIISCRILRTFLHCRMEWKFKGTNRWFSSKMKIMWLVFHFRIAPNFYFYNNPSAQFWHFGISDIIYQEYPKNLHIFFKILFSFVFIDDKENYIKTFFSYSRYGQFVQWYMIWTSETFSSLFSYSFSIYCRNIKTLK